MHVVSADLKDQGFEGRLGQAGRRAGCSSRPLTGSQYILGGDHMRNMSNFGADAGKCNNTLAARGGVSTITRAIDDQHCVELS